MNAIEQLSTQSLIDELNNRHNGDGSAILIVIQTIDTRTGRTSIRPSWIPDPVVAIGLADVARAHCHVAIAREMSHDF